MLFEMLPVELIREIFEYLDGFHIYKGFYRLNRRLAILALSTMGLYIDLRDVSLEECLQVSRSLMYSIIFLS